VNSGHPLLRVERVPGDLRRCTWLILGDNGSLEVGESRISVHFRPQIRSASRRGRYVERQRVKRLLGVRWYVWMMTAPSSCGLMVVNASNFSPWPTAAAKPCYA
jgi:hypothetical protein